MTKNRYAIYAVAVVAFAAVSIASCNRQNNTAEEQSTESITADAAHNSQNSLDWKGTYTGKIPCADCEGINVEITLSESTYVINYIYLGKDKDNKSQSTGAFEWNKETNTIKLDSKTLPPYYKVEEGKLIQLDMEGNPITGEHADMYILQKKM